MGIFYKNDIIEANRSKSTAEIIAVNPYTYTIMHLEGSQKGLCQTFTIPDIEMHWSIYKKALIKKEELICTCGAKYTSNPNYHLESVCKIPNKR